MTYKNITVKIIFSFLFIFPAFLINGVQSINQPKNPPKPCQGMCASGWCCNYSTGPMCPSCQDYQCECDENGCPGDCCSDSQGNPTGWCANSCCNSEGTGCESYDDSHTPLDKSTFHKFSQKPVDK